jgi:hypothetical protein
MAVLLQDFNDVTLAVDVPPRLSNAFFEVLQRLFHARYNASNRGLFRRRGGGTDQESGAFIRGMAFSKSELTNADQRITRTRDRLERQRELIQKLAEEGQDTNDAEALFKSLRMTLETLEDERRQIEDELFAAKAHRE